ncbi:MAG: ABC transporter [Clostridiales bacterium GWE2_32_10]|nr:MAG: ABC transporter [Clostridiales bacterium GWE2_32_10]HBY20708.1 ABC transporter [Clostridiales bacterium]
MIVVKSLTKKFDDDVILNGINMNVKKGSIYGIIGPNGSGKTTLLNHLVGVYRQDSGEIVINEKNIYDNADQKQSMAYMQDEIYAYPQYTIKNMAGFYKEMYKSWDDDRYKKLKEIFDIDDKKRITKLSKGMKKQVAFCFALSKTPEILIMDEPIDGLDPIARRKLWNVVIDDVAKREMTVIISSHNLKELENMCDTILILDKGKSVIERSIEDLTQDVHKIQYVLEKPELEDELIGWLNVISKEKMGTISVIVVKGDWKGIEQKMNEYNPVVLDKLNLTLEEVFIHEMEGLGYAIKNQTI